VEPQRRARLLNNQANELVKSGRYHEALQLYMEALRFSPQMPELYYNVGVALAVMERFEEARIALYKSKQLGLDVKAFPVDLYLAFCEAKVDNFEKAKRLVPELSQESEETFTARIEKLLESRNSKHDKENDG